MSQPSTPPEITPVLRSEHPELRNRPLVVTSFGLTDAGRVRPTNEDCFVIAELAKTLRVRQSNLEQPKTHWSDERGYLFLVADGMGGHQAGEYASALAVGTIEEFVLNTFKWFFHLQGTEGKNVLTDFQAALRWADRRVYDEAAQRPPCHGMGTTLTLAYALGADLFVVHVGDSRCYLLQGGKLRRLTRDHTVVSELVDRSVLSPEEAATHPYRHVITNAVGGHELGLQAEAHKVELGPGDAMLLCTDGLTEMVPDDRVATILQAEPDPRPACERLVTEAKEQGGKDNVTVIVARFEASEGGPRGGPRLPPTSFPMVGG